MKQGIRYSKAISRGRFPLLHNEHHHFKVQKKWSIVILPEKIIISQISFSFFFLKDKMLFIVRQKHKSKSSYE